ncbi:MAG TPA: nuclear transport factor 2 family protein [Polyangiaceae bacterium]|nr:nuclear transport factor 2 family protein [Polyangiaceae bacterium]
MLRALFRDFAATGDASCLIDRLTDDAVYWLTVGPGTPLSGKWVGKAGVARYFRIMHDTVRHDGFNVYDFLADESKAVVTGDETLYIYRNGVTFFTEWAVVFTFRGDLISHVLVLENLAPLSEAYAGSGG